MDLYNTNSQEVLERISRHCPEALSIYIQCINRSDFDGYVYFPREMVEIDMSEHWGKFRNNLKKLALENLLEWHPHEKGIAVTLAAIDAYE